MEGTYAAQSEDNAPAGHFERHLQNDENDISSVRILVDNNEHSFQPGQHLQPSSTSFIPYRSRWPSAESVPDLPTTPREDAPLLESRTSTSESSGHCYSFDSVSPSQSCENDSGTSQTTGGDSVCQSQECMYRL